MIPKTVLKVYGSLWSANSVIDTFTHYFYTQKKARNMFWDNVLVNDNLHVTPKQPENSVFETFTHYVYWCVLQNIVQSVTQHVLKQFSWRQQFACETETTPNQCYWHYVYCVEPQKTVQSGTHHVLRQFSCKWQFACDTETPPKQCYWHFTTLSPRVRQTGHRPMSASSRRGHQLPMSASTRRGHQ